jgi:hypothetical protein
LLFGLQWVRASSLAAAALDDLLEHPEWAVEVVAAFSDSPLPQASKRFFNSRLGRLPPHLILEKSASNSDSFPSGKMTITFVLALGSKLS